MSNAEKKKLLLRFFIRSEFTEDLRETCDMKSQVCRGGSADLYGLLMKSEATSQYMNKNKLQIVSGLGHTFIRFKDDEYKRFLYIDPTIAQFDPSFEGIFVGDEQDLYDIQKKQKYLTGYKLNINNYIEQPTPKFFSLFTKRKRPPLTIEKQLMNNALDDGRRNRRKRIIKNALHGGPLFTKKLPPSIIEEQFMNNALDDVPISRGKRTIKNENNSLYGGSRSRRRRTIKKRTD
jgi:hypothetical protein